MEKNRVRIIFVIQIAIALLILGSLFSRQIIHGKVYAKKSQDQYVGSASAGLERGSILFSQKDGETISAASVEHGYKISISPKEIIDADKTYSMLSEVLDINYNSFIEKTKKIDDPYEEIATRISLQDSKVIAEKKIPGVYLHNDNWRIYPAKNLSAQTIGFMSYKGDDIVGQYGLERYYQKVLAGPNGGVGVNFFAELFAGIKEIVTNDHNSRGSVVTSLEPAVTEYFTRILNTSDRKWNPEQVGGIIMDPTNGEIISMVNLPDFDINDFRKEKNVAVFSNPLVENVYEFGSVFKPIVMVSGLDAGVVKSSTIYHDNGTVVLNGKKISNFDKKAYGDVSMQEILGRSLNTGMVHVGTLLGRNKFRDYIKSFDVTEKTGIDLPNEATNLTSNLDSKEDIDYATIAFGQGIAMTPISATRTLSALANGGYLVKPHIVKKINYESGLSENIYHEPKKIESIKPESFSEISRMLVYDVDTYLANGKYSMKNYRVAAKTGTAQIAKANGKGYLEDKYIHSFFGYFPAYESRFVIFLFMIDPKGAQFSSETLTEPFMETVNYLIDYYKIPPDR